MALLVLTPWLPRDTPPSPESAQALRQLTNHEATDYHPIPSPSGKEVLFTSRRGGAAALFRIPIEGGEMTQVPIGLTGDLYSDWHPDEGTIVFDARDSGGPPDLYRYWLESGELRQLTDHPGMDGHPCFSPDGRRIAFMSTRGGSGDIWIMDVNGSNLLQLTHHPDEEWHPKWSPDGHRILFTSDRDGDADIWSIGVEGTGLRKLTSMSGTEDRGFWSPDGTRVVFQWENDLWIVDSNGGEPEQLTDFPGREGNPAWSADGRHIVFASDRSGNVNLWVLNSDWEQLPFSRDSS
jgi:Tol biopolymer transport system component